MCLLPRLSLDYEKLPINRESFESRVYTDLAAQDIGIYKLLKYRIDNVNLIHVLKLGLKADLSGVFNLEELSQGVRYSQGLPEYMHTFLVRLDSSSKIEPEDILWDEYIKYVSGKNKFLHDYFEFDRNLRNVTNAILLKKYDQAYSEKIVSSDNYVSETIISSNAPDFGLTDDMPFISEIREIIEREDYHGLERFLDILRFDIIDEFNRFSEFSLENVLGYSLQLAICERWQSLSVDEGQKRFDALAKKDIGREHLYSYVD